MATRKTVEELRALYRAIRSRSEAVDSAVFDAAVKALNPKTPAGFVKAAQRVTFPCRRCAGSGEFVTMMVNGKPTGPGGICFRCGGKGAQNDADAKRNRYFDEHFAGMYH